MAKKAWHEQTNIKKVEVNGIVFDSGTESRYYQILLDKQRAGLISRFELQPKYELLQKFEKFGKKHQAITYKPDFWVEYADGREVVIDVKGFEPKDWPLRMKMFDAAYPDLELVVLKECPKMYSHYADDPGFIEAVKLKKLQKEQKKLKALQPKKLKK